VGFVGCLRDRVLGSVDFPRRFTERPKKPHPFDNGDTDLEIFVNEMRLPEGQMRVNLITYHNVIKCIPLKMAFGNHTRGNER
jgi:hypothetical protein